MKTLTLYGFEPIQIQNGYSQLVIKVPEFFWQYQRFLIGDNSVLGGIFENNKELIVKNNVVFLGDLVALQDFNKIFGKKIIQNLMHYTSEESQHELYQLDNQMKAIVEQQILENELPFEISNQWSLDDLLKYHKLTLMTPENTTAGGIIRYIIKTAAQLGDQRLFVVNDMQRYLQHADHMDVIDTINELQLNFLELKQSGDKPSNIDLKAFHLIDEDFVMF